MIRAHAGKGEYGMLNKHRYRLDSAPFSLALFVLMLGCVLMLAVFGAQVYRALTETQSFRKKSRCRRPAGWSSAQRRTEQQSVFSW